MPLPRKQRTQKTAREELVEPPRAADSAPKEAVPQSDLGVAEPETAPHSLEASEVSIAPGSDEALMVAVMNGDREACDELYLRHATRLRAFIQRFVGRNDVADDLVQEVFLKVYRNPRAFDPRGRFLTWVFAVARNACIDWLRTKRLPTISIVPRDEDDERRSDPAAPATDPAHGPVLAELEGALTKVLRELSPKLREVFVLCSLQGLSYEDAAAVIGCPVKTVSSRLSRARDQVFADFQPFLGEGARRHRS